jgi:multiple sugar transport system permease protein
MTTMDSNDFRTNVQHRTSRRKPRLKWRAVSITLLRTAIIVAASLLSLFPIYWAVATSLKNPVDIGAIPPKWIFQPVLDHYRTMLYDWDMPVFLKSSLILSTISTVFCVLIGTMAAYSLSRFRMRGKQVIALDILAIRMVPPVVSAIPIFLLARRYGLYNSYGLVIALHSVQPAFCHLGDEVVH